MAKIKSDGNGQWEKDDNDPTCDDIIILRELLGDMFKTQWKVKASDKGNSWNERMRFHPDALRKFEIILNNHWFPEFKNLHGVVRGLSERMAEIIIALSGGLPKVSHSESVRLALLASRKHQAELNEIYYIEDQIDILIKCSRNLNDAQVGVKVMYPKLSLRLKKHADKYFRQQSKNVFSLKSGKSEKWLESVIDDKLDSEDNECVGDV